MDKFLDELELAIEHIKIARLNAGEKRPKTMQDHIDSLLNKVEEIQNDYLATEYYDDSKLARSYLELQKPINRLPC